ncbi:Gfo/Idh/MocA family protein [Phytoactinopolyspora halotolerans]|uniref:Gfo/Idh/MocA family oxidoreductase n=1 Tax=Phytoactinopolyspora halotolerans TaxID=1981512 RepID=A0A6L9SB42_9ACTN|nr:Gfo/Idh/MocA family oxidoreductase [Phytoactinopolyspora halotolerans]NEE01728.1 Gfo/Idh/MocA family oxidoreductase [Phytoactinopolyspora halotolerans]
MANEPIRVGILGLGRSGWNIHAAGLAELTGEYRIVAAADPDAERRSEAEARFGCVTYPEPADAIVDPQVELVIVATPSHTHVPLAVAALEAGKHVVAEKPMAQSVTEVDTMTEAAQRSGRVLTCFQNSRFDPAFMAIRELMDSGRLGELVMIRRTHHRFARRADWQTLRKFGGGELPNTASHFLDQVLLLLGDGPLDLFADLRRTVSAGDAEDHVKLVLKTKTGLTADIESSSAVAFPQPTWLVAGTAGSLVSTDDGGLRVRWCDPVSLPELAADEGPAAGRAYGTGEQIAWQEETIQVDPPGGRRTVLYYQHLAATLRDGAELFVTPDSVRRQIEVIERAREQTGML